MIPARKSALFARWFAWEAERRIRGAFGALRVAGLERVVAALREGPLIVVSNHTAWWDALLVLALCERVLRTDAYAMMDAQNLRRLPFFRCVGAFGVDLADPGDGARAMRYAARLLDRPGRLVWIFPQGREVPAGARPLGFRPGSAEIARISHAAVVPAALAYVHGERPEPSALVAFGEPLEPERDAARGRGLHENAVTERLGWLDRTLAGGDLTDLPALYLRKRGADRAERLLAWITRQLLPP